MSAARRRLTLLFTDLSGSTVLGRAIEAEHYSDMLDSVRAVWHGVAQRHGGHIVRTQGDGALLVFGLSAAGEDAMRLDQRMELLYQEVRGSGPASSSADVAAELHRRVRN